MGRIVMKVAKDQDRYVEWSTIVEAPVHVGTRAEMLRHLKHTTDWSRANPEERLRRADATGTSALAPVWGDWDDDYLIVKQLGLLPRTRLADYLDRVEADDEDSANALLEPFEDSPAPEPTA